MIHHLSVGVTDIERSAGFYDAALAPLGYVRVWEDETAVGYGQVGGGDKFAIRLTAGVALAHSPLSHIAFAAPTREAVVAFYREAMAHGGKDDGRPELCPEYGDRYFAGFVYDPDGYRVEAVINS